MKKYLIVFALFAVGSIVFLLFELHSDRYKDVVDKKNYVSIENKRFSLNGKYFYPIAVNYVATLLTDGNNYWASTSWDYYTTGAVQPIIKDSSLLRLKADMQLIKQMGFNTVRIVGIGEESVNNNEISVRAVGNNFIKNVILKDDESYKKYFDALEEMLKIVDKEGLKVILLLRINKPDAFIEKHLRKLVFRFRNNTTIMAYDLFNEPLYFDEPIRTKEEIYEMTRRWHKSIKLNAPNHLVTIGLASLREVFEWDPNIIDVDFVSFHPYEYEPEQVRNELAWYGRYVQKPWMIEETAIPADNDSVSYEEQKKFAHKTLKQAYNCGALGYTWWQYKDVHWEDYFSSYLGVINRTGETKTIKDNLIVQGTVKPMAEEIKKFDPTAKKDSCLCLTNYYNYSNGKACRIKGRLIDENDDPIEGGVILAWNQWWSHSYHTITKVDGSFELLGTFAFYHWMASATRYSMTRGDVLPDTAKTMKDNIPTMNIGNIKVKKLSVPKWYHFNN
jgi:hypothetical protein